MRSLRVFWKSEAKPLLVDALRRARLLAHADRVLYLNSLLRSRGSNAAFGPAHASLPLPPPHLVFDACGHTDYESYFESGVQDARTIADIVESNIRRDHVSVCEWGCGPARVLRHLGCMWPRGQIGLYGSDYNAESIEWCRSHLKGIHFTLNQMLPPLPFESQSFDCVYAISVFTHLSKVRHFDWIEELSRVLRPDGIVIFTTHGDSSTHELLRHEERHYRAGELVVRGNFEEGKRCYVAHQPPAFVQQQLLGGWRLVSHASFSRTQDIWVARRGDPKTARPAGSRP